MNFDQLKSFLDEQTIKFNVPGFIENDPISIPHQFEKKEDIEIAAFLTASIAWGNRRSIINNAEKLMKQMGYFPHEFVINANEKDFNALNNFVHRTFNGTDLIFFLKSLQNIYLNKGGLEAVFTQGYKNEGNLFGALNHFREVFLSLGHLPRTEKHVAKVAKKSSGKRLCMFMRWMVRNNSSGVDFGLWKEIPASSLMLPLDVHTGNVSRKLGLLLRKQNDWQAVEEVTKTLRLMDANDPVKYDFALFGLGVSNEI
ncbi:MAG TPA: TIGR02757 family protein [Prolixibacteraceae bacterium]|nr:TIGR02757 family protein [Prolixibacteraceae bacterium]